MLLAAVIAGGGKGAPAEAGAKIGKRWRGAEGGKDPAPGDTALIQGRIC